MTQLTLDEFYAMSAPATYVPNYQFDGPSINSRHAELIDAPLVPGSVKIDLPIRGSLRREDATKLYELAYFAEGDVLDIGTNRGLSASILSDALAGTNRRVLTVDMDAKLSGIAKRSLVEQGHQNVECHIGEASEWLAGLRIEGREFGFAFVDHSHEYRHVQSATAILGDLLTPGSYVAFHDFIDRRNGDADYPDYSVTAGALDGLGSRFTFAGTSGCMGIFRLVGGL